jgi:hypothetical protein
MKPTPPAKLGKLIDRAIRQILAAAEHVLAVDGVSMRPTMLSIVVLPLPEGP